MDQTGDTLCSCYCICSVSILDVQSYMELHSMMKSLEDSQVDIKPEILPPSIRDVDMGPPYGMWQPMQDPCPLCGGWRMQLGDYVCWGVCSKCAMGD